MCQHTSAFNYTYLPLYCCTKCVPLIHDYKLRKDKIKHRKNTKKKNKIIYTHKRVYHVMKLFSGRSLGRPSTPCRKSPRRASRRGTEISLALLRVHWGGKLKSGIGPPTITGCGAMPRP